MFAGLDPQTLAIEYWTFPTIILYNSGFPDLGDATKLGNLVAFTNLRPSTRQIVLVTPYAEEFTTTAEWIGRAAFAVETTVSPYETDPYGVHR